MEKIINIDELKELKNNKKFDEIAVVAYVLYNTSQAKEINKRVIHPLENVIAYFNTLRNNDDCISLESFKTDILNMKITELNTIRNSNFFDCLVLNGETYYLTLNKLSVIIDSQPSVRDKCNVMKDIIIASYFLYNNKSKIWENDFANSIAPTVNCRENTYYFGKRGKDVRIYINKILQSMLFWKNESLTDFDSNTETANPEPIKISSNEKFAQNVNIPNKTYLPDEIIEMFLKTKYSTNLVAKLMSNDGYKYAIAINEIAKLGIPYKRYIETIIDIESIMYQNSKIDSIIKTFPRVLKSTLNMKLEIICNYPKAEDMVSYLITYLYLIYNGNDSICGFSINDDNKDVKEVHMKNLQAANELLSKYVEVYNEHALNCVIMPQDINELPYLYKIHCSSIDKDVDNNILYYYLTDTSLKYRRVNGDLGDKVTLISRKFISDVLNLDTKIVTESGDVVVPFITDGECIEYYKDVLEKRKATILENIDKIKKASTEMKNELIKKLNSIETIINDL